MSFIKLFSLLLVIALSGCNSNSASNYYEPDCSSPDAYCLFMAIADVIDNKSSDKKCSDMDGEQRKNCDAQVASLKKHINNASKK